jgi:hypothetical protein
MSQALGLIYTEPTRAKEGIEIIEAILRRKAAAPGNTDVLDWKLGFYACFAAKARVALKDFEGARRIIADTLKIDPDDAQLQFLKRLLENGPAATR